MPGSEKIIIGLLILVLIVVIVIAFMKDCSTPNPVTCPQYPNSLNCPACPACPVHKQSINYMPFINNQSAINFNGVLNTFPGYNATNNNIVILTPLASARAGASTDTISVTTNSNSISVTGGSGVGILLYPTIQLPNAPGTLYFKIAYTGRPVGYSDIYLKGTALASYRKTTTLRNMNYYEGYVKLDSLSRFNGLGLITYNSDSTKTDTITVYDTELKEIDNSFFEKQANRTFTRIPRKTFSGNYNNPYTLTDPTIEDCEEACRKDLNCNAYHYNTLSKSCWPYSDFNNVWTGGTDNENVIAGMADNMKF